MIHKLSGIVEKQEKAMGVLTAKIIHLETIVRLVLVGSLNKELRQLVHLCIQAGWLVRFYNYKPCSNSTVSGTIAPFTHFSLFFPSFCSLTHIPLS